MKLIKKIAGLLRTIRPQTITHNVKPTDYKWILNKEKNSWIPVKAD